MKVYADYNFYENAGGTMSKDEFDRAALKASAFIREVTIGKADSYSGEELSHAMCEVADIFHTLGGNTQKASIKSESNDGYSVAFVNEIAEGETQEALARRKAYAVVKMWLSGTGLLSRKVGCRCRGECYDNEC